MPENCPRLQVEQGPESSPAAFLEAAGLVKSRGDAKRQMRAGALRVNGEVCDDAALQLGPGDYEIRLGKKNFLLLTVLPARAGS